MRQFSSTRLRTLSAALLPLGLATLVACTESTADPDPAGTGGTDPGAENPGTGGNGTTASGGNGAGTGGASASGGAEAGSGGTNAGSGGEAGTGYPSGPYGEDDPDVGEVLENLNLRGFRRIGDGTVVSTGSFETFTLSDLRGNGSGYGLVLVGAVWCPSCASASDDLGAAGDALTAEGVTVIQILNHGARVGSMASENELSVWASNHNLTVTIAGAVDDRVLEVFGERSYAYVVKLDTMEVVWAKHQTFSTPTIGQQGVDAVRTFL